MQDNTFVYLWRSILDTSFYKKPLTCHLAIHLILSAAWADHKTIIAGKEVLIRRGQIATGRERLASETGLSPQNIRTSIEVLRRCDFLTIESTKVCSIITICNYSNYQTCQPSIQPSSQPTTNQRPTNDQPLHNERYERNKDKDLSASADAGNGEAFYLDKKGRKLTGKRLESFNLFWKAWGDSRGKSEAAQSWYDIPQLTNALVEQIVTAASRYAEERPKIKAVGGTPKMAQGWLSARRWEDEPVDDKPIHRPTGEAYKVKTAKDLFS